MSEPQRGSETVLVVEDDALVRGYVVAQLKSLGYHTITAANGPDALALLNQGVAFDVLFTDVVMPGGMNGRELADAVTRRRPGVPVLYTSGYPEAAMMHDRPTRVLPCQQALPESDLARLMRQVLAPRAVRDGSS